MTETEQFIIRTEDIRLEDIKDLFVETDRDRELISALKAANPLVIEGSRGTGKSFLLRICEVEQSEAFENDRVLPVYVSFVRSSLLHASNPGQFQSWMMARICSGISRALKKRGILGADPAIKRVLDGRSSGTTSTTKLEEIAEAFEQSYRTPGAKVDDTEVPDVETFREAIEDLCRNNNIRHINLLFDEAAHIFRPEQQRQFFTLFRDLRSPFLSCNAAVYPGVTIYGDTFESGHDARIESLNRSTTNNRYREEMREIIFKQANSRLQRDIDRNGESFDALAYAVSGNPRLLLKTITLAPALRTGQVQTAIKDFYRTTIWAEHSALGDRYPGHKKLIDWGRKFIEETAIEDALLKNRTWKQEGKPERTCFFWVHKDAPEAAKEALRLLAYTGIVTKLDSGVVATRSEIGTRYAINLGCLAAPEANPIAFITDLKSRLSVKRFTEYGENYRPFTELADSIGPNIETDSSSILKEQLEKPISALDLTEYQKNALVSIHIDNIGQALSSSEAAFQNVPYIGPKRSRRIMNVVTAAVLEFLSG